MNKFEALLALKAGDKKKRGVEFTPAEIAQQPDTWRKTAAILTKNSREIKSFMAAAGLTGRKRATVVFTGAGTSEFIGNSIQPVVRRLLGREVLSLPTTHLVTHAPSSFIPGQPYVVVSFARSGNSPESVATYNLVRQVCPQAYQLVITCNKDGALAKAAAKDKSALCILLPEETNDKSLVMTSSFSNMALAGMGLGFMNDTDALAALADQLGNAVTGMIARSGDVLAEAGSLAFNRACFLGSNSLYGTMQECHLKMQEMTAGRVACRFDSFLGLRHGPQVFANQDCLIFGALASDPYVRRYELDLLKELKTKKQGLATLVVCGKAGTELKGLASHVVELFPKGKPVADDFRVLTDVAAGQILGVFKSMAVGLKPDSPSPDGTINRVVQGVTIYPLK